MGRYSGHCPILWVARKGVGWRKCKKVKERLLLGEAGQKTWLWLCSLKQDLRTGRFQMATEARVGLG